MTVSQVQEATDKARLINACNNFAKAIKNAESAYTDPIRERKGKTLFRINRERQNTVKMTVNY